MLHTVGIAIVAFASTSLDNLGVLTALFTARELRPLRLAVLYLGVTWALTGLGWAAAILAELAIAERLDYLGWVPIALGLRGAWLLRRPDAMSSLPGGELAAALLVLATSADNLLISLALFAHAPAALDLILFATLLACAAVWCALAFWLARRSPIAALLQRAARPLLPFVLIAIGVYMLAHAPNGSAPGAVEVLRGGVAR